MRCRRRSVRRWAAAAGNTIAKPCRWIAAQRASRSCCSLLLLRHPRPEKELFHGTRSTESTHREIEPAEHRGVRGNARRAEEAGARLGELQPRCAQPARPSRPDERELARQREVVLDDAALDGVPRE